MLRCLQKLVPNGLDKLPGAWMQLRTNMIGGHCKTPLNYC
jgi:hypothetical protein